MNKGGLKNYLLGLLRQGNYDDKTPIRRHRPDYQIVLFMGLLMMLGLITIYAIGPQRANVLNNAYGSTFSDTYFFIKQLGSLALAIIAFLFFAYMPYTKVTRYAGLLIAIAVGACLLLVVADISNLSIAQSSLGATRWYNLGILGSFQPAELLKFGLLIFLSGFIGRKVSKGEINDNTATLWPIAILAAVSLFLVVVIQKDLGTGLALVSIILSMLYVGGVSAKNFGKIFLVGLAVGLVLIFSAPHRVQRIMTYFQGDATTSSDGSDYHIEHAKLAIGTGGLFGVGIGNSVQATGYLPEAINDSVFAIMGETFGFVGLIVILGIFFALLFRILKLMDHMPDIRLKLIYAGLFGWLGAHVILNITSMVGIFPLTGITLPLLSFGGTSMIFIASALGLGFQLSHYTVSSLKLKEATRHEGLGSRRGIGRTRHSSRGGFTRN